MNWPALDSMDTAADARLCLCLLSPPRPRSSAATSLETHLRGVGKHQLRLLPGRAFPVQLRVHLLQRRPPPVLQRHRAICRRVATQVAADYGGRQAAAVWAQSRRWSRLGARLEGRAASGAIAGGWPHSSTECRAFGGCRNLCHAGSCKRLTLRSCAAASTTTTIAMASVATSFFSGWGAPSKAEGEWSNLLAEAQHLLRDIAIDFQDRDARSRRGADAARLTAGLRRRVWGKDQSVRLLCFSSCRAPPAPVRLLHVRPRTRSPKTRHGCPTARAAPPSPLSARPLASLTQP